MTMVSPSSQPLGDAIDVTPAHCERVITVAASDINDTKAWSSIIVLSLISGLPRERHFHLGQREN